jgi:asparagine synthase (glutamine-hydrolysing)
VSAICGIAAVDGAPVDPAWIDAMLDALDHWRADARGSWRDEHAALGHLLLRTTAYDGAGSQPAHDEASRVSLTGDLRLDNRRELARLFGIDAIELASMSDSELALRAYARWGEDCAAHLDGDFAFAVHDAARQRLFCARDRFGVKPLYYFHRGGTLAFATEMKGLLALPFVDRSIDEAWIGEYLHRIASDGVSTFYACIRRLEPAHTLILDAAGFRLRKYWELDPSRELTLPRDEDYVEAFREQLHVAIRRRADTPCGVGAELSGGLDSAAICAIAQGILRAEGRQLHTFSQVRPPDLQEDARLPADFRWAIDALCRHAFITARHEFAGEGGILEAIDWANARCDEPTRDSSSLYNHGLYEAAAAAGVRVLLSGFGGNQCISEIGRTRLRELLWQGQWIELWRELSAVRDRSPLVAGLGLLLAELDGSSWYKHRWRSMGRQAFPERPTTDRFARRMRLRRRTYEVALRRARKHGVRAHAIQLLTAPGVALRFEHANLATLGRRIEYRYPLFDADLIALYLALPSRFKYWRGTSRYIFRRSIDGLVPDEVRLAAGSRGSSNPGNILRKQRDEAALKARLSALLPDNPLFRYVDPTKLTRQPKNPARYPRERHTDMAMVLALEYRLRNAHLPDEGVPR